MKKNICVYCSSSNYLNEKYYKLAQALGEKIAINGYNLVYGGTTVGCMGQVASSVIHNGGNVLGVIPQRIADAGLTNPNLAKTIITKDMRERKATMEKNSDAFIAIPGGFGTFEEIFEIIVGKQLGYHKKPIIFLNVDNFYNPLFQMFENLYSENFAKEEYRSLYHITEDINDIFDYLANYKEIEFVHKW